MGVKGVAPGRREHRRLHGCVIDGVLEKWWAAMLTMPMTRSWPAAAFGTFSSAAITAMLQRCNGPRRAPRSGDVAHARAHALLRVLVVSVLHWRAGGIHRPVAGVRDPWVLGP
ncbi:MAG: hypothetical protein EBY24_12935 [Betaproteobacteria bacterium]|nr:hypothetical protein [Betaproteobacteria bacterium]